MKVITSVQGTVALQVSADDVAPSRGIVISDLIRVIGEGYRFSVRPPIQQGPLPGLMQQFVFQSGELETEQGKFPILQLVIRNDADIVTSVTTDIADKIIDDYMLRLDKELQFRFTSALKRKVFQSNVVVEFEEGLDKKIDALGKIETLLDQEIKRQEYPFKIKRLAFGFGPTAFQPIPSLLAIERSDFVMERRDPEPYDKNRYFCVAPTSTSEHIRILELIEKKLAG
jgi:hypothetical protein